MYVCISLTKGLRSKRETSLSFSILTVVHEAFFISICISTLSIRSCLYTYKSHVSSVGLSSERNMTKGLSSKRVRGHSH